MSRLRKFARQLSRMSEPENADNLPFVKYGRPGLGVPLAMASSGFSRGAGVPAATSAADGGP